MARRNTAQEAANDSIRLELKTVVDNRTVGEILREARIARDEDFAQVCEQLRIRRAYMEAIEEGRFGDLPGSTYAIGFVRTYAEYLNLDVAKMVAKYKQEASDFEDQTRLVFPEPMPASRGPTASVIVIALVLLFGSYAGWLYVSNKDREQIDLVPPLPEALQKLIDGIPLGGTDPSPEPALPAETAPPPAAAKPAETVPETAPTADEPAAVPVPAGTTVSPAAQAAAAEETPAIVNETITAETPTIADQVETVVDTQPAPAALGPETTAAAPERVEEAAQTAAEQAPPVVQQATTTAPEAVTDSAPSAPAPPEAAATPVEPLAEAVETAIPQAVPQADEPAVVPQPAPTAVVDEPPVQQAAVVSDPLATPLPAETQTVLVPGISEPTTYGEADGASRIVVRSSSAAWVEITEQDGSVLLTRLLRPGDTFRVPDRPGITLVTGNAGGLEFLVDGALAPAIGEIGDVRRDVLLEPDALLQGTAASGG